MGDAAAPMSKVYSVEDIVSNLTKAGSLDRTFPRTDSEQAFQEFLKRIPSSNSLAAFGQAGSQSDLAAQAAHIHSLQAQALASQAAAAALSTPEGAAAGGNGAGVPRVASLDFFRQLLPVNQLNVSRGSGGGGGATSPSADGEGSAKRNGVKTEASAAAAAFSPPPPPFQSELPPIQSVGTSSADPPRSGPPPARTASPQPAAGGAAASGRVAEREKELSAKAELRRARRMLSNRESARRSRKRKQEHLGELQGQIQALQDQQEDLEGELAEARAAIKKKDAEIAALRAQLDGRHGTEALTPKARAGGGSPTAADKAPATAGKRGGKPRRGAHDGADG